MYPLSVPEIQGVNACGLQGCHLHTNYLPFTWAAGALPVGYPVSHTVCVESCPPHWSQTPRTWCCLTDLRPVCCTHPLCMCAVRREGTHISQIQCINCFVSICIGVLASDSSSQASRVQVAIQTLDENDNAPQLAEPYDTFVCDSAAPGQVSSDGSGGYRSLRPPGAHLGLGPFASSQLIQVIRALDRDEVGNSSRVSLQGPLGPDANFTVRDNRGRWPPWSPAPPMWAFHQPRRCEL